MTGATTEFYDLDGPERVRSQIDGKLPLSASYVLAGIRPTRLNGEEVECSMPVACAADGKGGIDPSALAYFADAPMALAVVSTIERNLSMRSIVLRLTYQPPGTLGAGDLVASARLSSVSDSTGSAAVAIRDGGGSILATGSLEGLVVSAGQSRMQSDTPLADREPPLFVEWPVTGRPPDIAFRDLLGLESWTGNTLIVPADPWLSTHAGLVYGGAMVSIAQTAAAKALAHHPHQLREFGYHFVRTVSPDGRPIRAFAQFRHLGRRMAVIDVEVTNAAGSAVGFGRATATA